MTNDDRRLIVETLAEMKELKGEMREFKEHVIGRVSTLEKKEGGTGQTGVVGDKCFDFVGGPGGECHR
jgi:hypothetical protein